SRAGGDDQAEWLRRDRDSVGQSLYPAPLVIERGSGCELWDLAGSRYLDFESGQFCMRQVTLIPRSPPPCASRSGN
ncbi:MAG: hypothetical protein ACTHQQ_12730, partial [Solirubrobacteraceae bacterium]